MTYEPGTGGMGGGYDSPDSTYYQYPIAATDSFWDRLKQAAINAANTAVDVWRINTASQEGYPVGTGTYTGEPLPAPSPTPTGSEKTLLWVLVAILGVLLFWRVK